MPIRSLAPLALVLLADCAEPTRGCDICTSSAIVYGTVTTAAGAAGAGASVRAYVGQEPCSVRAPAEEAARTVAGGTGRYRAQVQSLFGSPQCVQVEASGAAATSGRVEVPVVRFKPTADASLPYDSIRVDVRLP
jgi:hypothetical protein